MAARTFVKNLIAQINGKKRREREVVIIRFLHYKSTARMLAVALERGMELVPGFLDNTRYIEYLTLMFKSDNGNLSLLLSSLSKFGFTEQENALVEVYVSYNLTLHKIEDNMNMYIDLLWALFHTPDPE
jgi:hypothetical protein